MPNKDVPSLEVSLWVSGETCHMLLGLVTSSLNLHVGLKLDQAELVAKMCADVLARRASMDVAILTVQPLADLNVSMMPLASVA